MATLKEAHKVLIVTELACNTPPSEIRDLLNEKFGLDDVPASQITFYNPETVAGAERLSKKWKELYYETREKWLNDTSDEPAAHKAVRVRMLAKGARKAEQMDNYVLMADLLEQIAKEMGGKFTNKHLLEHSGPDGGPIDTRNANIDFTETDDPKELIRRYEELFADE